MKRPETKEEKYWDGDRFRYQQFIEDIEEYANNLEQKLKNFNGNKLCEMSVDINHDISNETKFLYCKHWNEQTNGCMGCRNSFLSIHGSTHSITI